MRLAICTLIEDRTPMAAVRRWLDLDTGDLEIAVYACRHDASETTQARFLRELTWAWPVYWVDCADLDERVPDIEHAHDDAAYNIIWSHKVSCLREAVRIAAVEADPRPDFLLWLDSDTAPEPNAVTCLLEDVCDGGRFAPRFAAAPYPCRRTGKDIIRHWGQTGDGDFLGSVPLRTGQVLAAGWTGFGAVLCRAETMADPYITWSGFGDYRYKRRLECELHHSARVKAGIQIGSVGEDIYLFRRAEERFGVPVYIDCRTAARHYIDDDTWFEYVDQGGRLVARRFSAEEEPEEEVPLEAAGV